MKEEYKGYTIEVQKIKGKYFKYKVKWYSRDDNNSLNINYDNPQKAIDRAKQFIDFDLGELG